MFIISMVFGCAGTETTPTTETDAEAGCGTLYGTDLPDCPLECEAGSYCTSCMAAPDTSDTSLDTVWACVPCGAAC